MYNFLTIKKHIIHSLTSRNQSRYENSSSSLHVIIYLQLRSDKISFQAVQAGSCVDTDKERRWVNSVCLFGVKLCHKAWRWLPRHVWMELTGLLYPQHVCSSAEQVNLWGPPLLALAEIKSGAECWDFHVSAHELHINRQTHTKKLLGSENVFSKQGWLQT